MNDLDFALTAYEHALRHNPRCVPALSQVAGIARIKENYPKVCNRARRQSYLLRPALPCLALPWDSSYSFVYQGDANFIGYH